ELLRAHAKITRELERNPNSVRSLDLRARVEMIGLDPETAVATLQYALERRRDDPDLMADLGMAYALRAEGLTRDSDYWRAAEYLERALKARPNSAATIFNLALVYGRMSRYEDAMREWRRYLDVDRAGPWRDEAQRRLGELQGGKNALQH